MKSAPTLRAALASRDAFMAVVAEKLVALVSDLERHDYPAARRADLVSFVRELGIIARPAVPVTLRRTKTDLLATVSSFVASAPLAARGLVATEERRGAIAGAWDTELLGTLFAELASNAMKYRGSGPVTVTVDVTRGAARIVVENDGAPALPKGKPARFVRGEARRNVRGYGVGLWLVERIAKAHGGRARLTSRQGKTRAIVTLPFTRASADATLAIRIDDAPPTRSRARRGLPFDASTP